eukprot:9478241-Pyramimonas_sp.AAC.2
MTRRCPCLVVRQGPMTWRAAPRGGWRLTWRPAWWRGSSSRATWRTRRCRLVPGRTRRRCSFVSGPPPPVGPVRNPVKIRETLYQQTESRSISVGWVQYPPHHSDAKSKSV